MKKILFIEDESTLQKTFEDVLTHGGYKVISALDGKIGLRLAKSEKPDLILLDLVLPSMHGFEVLKELKKNSETESIPVIILTNLEKMEDVEKAIELGAKTYLVKTKYAIEEIMEKIKKILSE
ncbi:response regulator [Patescibacteria group bacterium]|nr:response regulator [Patescibacteria group bacterium]